MIWLNDKRNVLLVFLILVTLFFGYFSYQQNQVIEVLNQEVLKQAQRGHRLQLKNYSLEKELDKLKAEEFVGEADSLITTN
tara:strand:- start:576 stop:818 length:243 start_codon:yes stop_codon:yes gene_type:complete